MAQKEIYDSRRMAAVAVAFRPRKGGDAVTVTAGDNEMAAEEDQKRISYGGWAHLLER